MQIKDGNYYTKLGWMRTRLFLKGIELEVYAIVYGFCQDKINAYELGINYIMDWTGDSESTVRRALHSLVEKGFITSEERAGKPTLYRCVALAKIGGCQNETPFKMTPLSKCEGCQNETPVAPPQTPPINNIYNNQREVCVVCNSACECASEQTTQTFTFKDWWNLYGMQDYSSQIDQCMKFWSVLNNDEREKVMKHTEAFAPINLEKPHNRRKQPIYYLCVDKRWKDDISTITTCKESKPIESLSGKEQDYNWKNNIPMVQVKAPDGKYYILTTSKASELGLKVVKNWGKIS